MPKYLVQTARVTVVIPLDNDDAQLKGLTETYGLEIVKGQGISDLIEDAYEYGWGLAVERPEPHLEEWDESDLTDLVTATVSQREGA